MKDEKGEAAAKLLAQRRMLGAAVEHYAPGRALPGRVGAQAKPGTARAIERALDKHLEHELVLRATTGDRGAATLVQFLLTIDAEVAFWRGESSDE